MAARRAWSTAAGRSSTARALGGTIVGNAPGFALPFAVAGVFGIGELTDAYFLGFAAAVFVASLANVVVESNLLPLAHHARQRGRAAVGRFAVQRSAQLWVAAALVFAVVAVAIPAVMPARGAAPDDVLHGVLWWFGAYVTLTVACSVLTACLYAHERFFLPPATGSLRAWFALAALAVAPVSPHGLQVVAAAWAAGEALRLFMLAVALWRVAAPSGEAVTAEGAVWRPLLTHALAMCVVGLVPVIDRAFAARLDPGAVTILELADKIVFVPVLILTSSITVVAGNRWARAYTSGDDPRTDGADVFRLLGLLSAAIAVVLVAGAVGVALATPTLHGVDSLLLAGVVVALAIGLPTAVLVNASIRFLTATADTRLLPRFALLTLVGNLVLDAIAVATIGLVGIALATTLTRTLSVALYLRLIFPRGPATPATPVSPAAAQPRRA